MIKIDRHIEILLLNNDCVIVPGLGGFMAHHIPARYYVDSQSFTPPLRQLGFNSQLQINDSLLAQAYIETYDISYPEALRRIASEVEELKQTLQNEGSCELHGIGTLRQTINGRIEFEPCEAGLLTPSLYALNSLNFPFLETYTNTTKGTTEEFSAPKPVPHLASSKNSSLEEGKDEGEEYSEPVISIKISTIKHIATAAAVFIALFICAIPFGKLYQPELNESFADTGILFNILPEELREQNIDSAQKTISFNNAIANNSQDSAAAENDEQALGDSDCMKNEKDTGIIDSNNSATEAETPSKNEEAKAITKKEVDKTPTKKEVDKTPTKKEEKISTKNEARSTSKKCDKKESSNTVSNGDFYSIVIASQVAKNNAEIFVNKLHALGLDKAEVVEHEKGRKVIYGRFKTQAEAYKYLKSIRDANAAFEEGWIMKFNK